MSIIYWPIAPKFMQEFLLFKNFKKKNYARISLKVNTLISMIFDNMGIQSLKLNKTNNMEAAENIEDFQLFTLVICNY